MLKFNEIFQTQDVFIGLMKSGSPFVFNDEVATKEIEFLQCLYKVLTFEDIYTLFDEVDDLVITTFQKHYALYMYSPFMKFIKIMNSLLDEDPTKAFDTKEERVHTRKGESSDNNTGFSKTAVTPTKIGLSDDYIEEYSDSQSKATSQRTKKEENNLDEVVRGNMGDYYSVLNRLPYSLISEMIGIYRGCFFYYLNDDEDL